MKARVLWLLAASLFVALVALGAAAPSQTSAQSQTQAAAPCPAPDAPNGVDVCVDRGEGARYTEGDPIRICVTVSIPMIEIYPPPPAPLVRVTNSVNGGTPQVLFEESLWSGQRCLTATITPPLGQEVIRAEVIGHDGRVIASDSVSYTSAPRSSTPSTARVTVDRGVGGVYAVGDPIRICYRVPGPGPVTLTDILADGRSQVLRSGWDDDTGDCIAGTVTPPTGRECLRLEYSSARGSGSTETCFQVVGAEPPDVCIQIYPPPPGCEDPNAPVSSHGGPVRDLVSLIDALCATGATVSPAGRIPEPGAASGERPPRLLSGTAWQITVNDEGVQVYEYADEAAAAVDAARISPDGDHFGNPPTVSVNWVAPPHFYRAGRLIVLYVGRDPAVLRTLEAALGPQFAGR